MKSRIVDNILITLLVGGLGLFSSCEGFMDDFLDTTEGSQTEVNYFETENRVDRGIGAIYSQVGILYGTNMESGAFATGPLCRIWSLPGDELTIDRPTMLEFEAFENLQNDHGNIWSYWCVLYTIIGRANFMLDILDDPSNYSSDISQEHINNCKGEALFMRAFCDIRLFYNFHKAPNQNMRITSVDGNMVGPSEGFELLDQAIGDLIQAEELLPESWDSANKGRVFKNSARGLLTKAYVLRACYANKYNGNAEEDYKNAISAFERISQVSTIEGVNFSDNFDYEKENNQESLYEYQASFNISEDNPWLNGNQGSNSAQIGVMWFQFRNDSYNYMISDATFGPTQKFVDIFEEGDPRFEETFCDRRTDENWNKFNGYQFYKYNKRDGALDATYNTMSRNNPRILRLADVKLLVAEAYLQTGQEPKAREQVNDIRRRARGDISDVPADYVSAIGMQQIMDERMRELGGEDDIRITDLKRWHVAGYIDLADWARDPENQWGYPYNDDISFKFDPNRDLLFPIPTEEMNSNPLMQNSGNNPGY
jgi:SusD family.